MAFQTVQIMFKAKDHLLPGSIQKLFTKKEGGYNLRGNLNFKTLSVHSTRRSFCVSVYGVTLWNSLNVELTERPNIKQFKKRYKEICLLRYRNQKGVYISPCSLFIYLFIYLFVCLFIYLLPLLLIFHGCLQLYNCL